MKMPLFEMTLIVRNSAPRQRGYISINRAEFSRKKPSVSVQAHRCEPRYHMGWIRIGESTDPYTVTCVIASCWILYMCEYDSYRFVQQLFEHVCAPLSCRFFVSSLHQFFVPVLSFNVVLYTSFSTLIPMGKTFVYRLIRAWQASINTRSFPPMKSTGG